MNFIAEVAKLFNNSENFNNLENVENLLVSNMDISKGDVSLPCFSFAKTLRKAPNIIATEIAEHFKQNSMFENVVAVNGYVNFMFNKNVVIENVLNNVEAEKDGYGNNSNHSGEVAFVDHCSANLAKYLHIGHLGTTVIGAAIRRILEANGFNVFGLNFVGDFGTPFGKMITAIKKWSDFNKLKNLKGEQAVDAVQELYVKFNVEVENNESLIEDAREWSLKIENGDLEAVEIFNWITTETKAEVERICSLLGISFHSWRGENYYSNKIAPVIAELDAKGLTKISEGAKIVDLNEFGLGVCVIEKSNGGSLYVTRDLAAVEDRYNEYKFNRGIYVTSVAQKLHFAQWFKICELLGKSYAKGLEHVYYGQYSLPTGKIASRLGKQALIKDMIRAAQDKAKEVMNARGTKVENVETASMQIATSAIMFGMLKNEKIKDSVFDMEQALNFDGETAPYMQYTFARTNSIINNCLNLNVNVNNCCFENLATDESYALIKLINNFPKVVVQSYEKLEPCVISRYLLDLCSAFNKFYNNARIIDNGVANAERYLLTKAVNQVLKNGFKILGISAIEKM